MLDPGQTCGLLYAELGVGGARATTESRPLAWLVGALSHTLQRWETETRHGDELVLVYETFYLVPGKARQQGGSSMPSSEGIGVFRAVAHLLGHSAPIGVPPNCKTAGRAYAVKHLPSIAAARDAANNEHERDACDLAGYVLRQRKLGKAPFA